MTSLWDVLLPVVGFMTLLFLVLLFERLYLNWKEDRLNDEYIRRVRNGEDKDNVCEELGLDPDLPSWRAEP